MRIWSWHCGPLARRWCETAFSRCWRSWASASGPSIFPRRYPLVRSADWCSAVRFSPITMCCWRTSRQNDLDAEWSERVFELLRGFCATEGRSVVLVTHDRSYAAQADKVYLLEGGKLREEVTL